MASLKPQRLTGVGAEVSCQGVTTATGVVTKGAFEGLLARMELDVSQQVALLSEGGPTLVTLEWPLTYRDQDYQFSHRPKKTAAHIFKLTFLNTLLFFCQELVKKHLPVWLRLCTIKTLGPMQIIPHISHLSFPLGSRMGPGMRTQSWPSPRSRSQPALSVPPTISTPPSSANSPFSSFHPSSFSPTLLSASGAPAASSSLYSSTLMELAGNGEKVVHYSLGRSFYSK